MGPGAEQRRRASRAMIAVSLLLLAVSHSSSAQEIPEPLDPEVASAAAAALLASNSLPTAGTTAPELLATLKIPKYVRNSNGIDAVLVEASNATTLTLRPIKFTKTVAAKIAADAAAAEPLVTAAAMDPLYGTILSKHNNYRATHQAGPLAWNDALAAAAASYASRCVWAHDPNANAGENLYLTSVTGNPAGALTSAIDAWYNEVALYNFNNPGFSTATGHFTQVVWKSSTSLGCAARECPNIAGFLRGTFVVCRYLPTGNVLGQFPQNVAAANGGGGGGTIPPATIPQGYMMSSPGCLSSVDKRFRFCMQADANVVLYKGSRAIWASSTQGRSTATPFRLVMQTDGNLVAYDKGNKAFWASGTNGRGAGPYRLVVQNDGNVVLYANNVPTWATNTSGQ